jgi:hypothetical protein
MNRRTVLAGAAALLLLAPVLAAGQAADASDGGSTTVTCSGSSCAIELENDVTFTGNYSRGVDNTGVYVAPPPCQWVDIGNAQVGSGAIIYNLENIQEIDPPLTAQQTALLAQAQKIQAQNPAGEWYGGPISTGSGNSCGTPNDVWVPAAKGGGTPPPPPVQLPPSTLAELALAVMKLPKSGKVETSPVGKTYANMPTFVRVTLNGRHEMAGGTPYLVVTASLDGVGATAWAYGAPLSLTVSGTDPQIWSKCGPLGSEMMADDPGAVAKTGVGGSADCGFTPTTPGTTTITATMGWQTCWVPEAEAGEPAPPAGCNPVPDAQLDALQWQDGIAVYEIQTNNG